MAVPADQESIRGIKSFTLGSVETKPTGFTFNPGAEQKRVPSFDSNGYKTPGYPALIAKDYNCSITWGAFNGSFASLAQSFDTEYSVTIDFATTTGGSFSFSADGMVIDGQGLSFDPLGDAASISFIITDTDSVVFG
jgi:hypothetical protein